MLAKVLVKGQKALVLLEWNDEYVSGFYRESEERKAFKRKLYQTDCFNKTFFRWENKRVFIRHFEFKDI